MTIGRGIDDGVTVGPLVDSAAIDKVTELVADAVDKGATVLTGGTAIDGPGHFYPPTVLTGVPTTAKVFREEIFGPVAPIITFSSDQEGIDKANDTEYGLVAYAFTENLTRALTVAEKLQTGMVGINQGIVSNPAAPVRRRQGLRPRPRGRHRGHRGVPGDQVRRHQALTGLRRVTAELTISFISAVPGYGHRCPPDAELTFADRRRLVLCAPASSRDGGRLSAHGW